MKTIHFSFVFATFFVVTLLFSTTNAQIEILQNGAAKIGNASFAQIQSGASLKMIAPEIAIGTTDEYSLQIRANESELRLSSPEKTYIYISGLTIGFKFHAINLLPTRPLSESSETESGLGNIVLPPPTPTKAICMTGAASNTISYIGQSSAPINKIYANNIYTTDGNTGVLSLSDARLKKNITKISSTKDKIKALNVVKYDFARTLENKDISNAPNYKNRVGLLAQEVKNVFPDIVYYDPNDSVFALDYAGLIPYMIKSDQEQQDAIFSLQEKISEQQERIENQQQQIEHQEEQIIELKKAISSLQDNKDDFNIDVKSDNQLFQNAPNPFNQSTKIKYILVENAKMAQICIYNLNGKQLRCFNLDAIKGASSIEIRASDLQAGIYLYTLIVNNNPVSTKRMILTE